MRLEATWSRNWTSALYPATVDFFGFALVCHGRIANLTYFLCNHEVKVWESRQEKLEKTGVITLDVLDPRRYILCFGFRIIRC